MSYYAVLRGRTKGVYKTWDECKNQTNGYPRALFKKFKTETEAQTFIDTDGEDSGPSLGFKYLSKVTKPSHSTRECSKCCSRLIIYTHGVTLRRNSDTASSGIGVYYGLNDPRNISMAMPGTINGVRSTNEIAELLAIRYMLRNIYETQDPKVHYIIRSNSQYSLKSILIWLKRWERNGYVNKKARPVQNRDLIRECFSLYNDTQRSGCLDIEYVRDDRVEEGVHAAKKLANQAAVSDEVADNVI